MKIFILFCIISTYANAQLLPEEMIAHENSKFSY
jgi:hypothetical protein